MAYRLCLALGVLHPNRLLEKLTSQEWQGWLQFADEEPFGEVRDDLRMDAFRERLMAGMFGGEEYARSTWPYWDEQPSADDVKNMTDNTEADIEPDGKGGYRWRVQRLLD